MVLLITAGQRHEQTMFEPLMERGMVKRRIRRYLRGRGIGAVIARQTRERPVRFDAASPPEMVPIGVPGWSAEWVVNQWSAIRFVALAPGRYRLVMLAIGDTGGFAAARITVDVSRHASNRK